MEIIEQLRHREGYLTTIEVMAILRIRRNTLCAWVRTGRIMAVRVGNAYLYDPRWMAEWLAARQTKNTSGRGAV